MDSVDSIIRIDDLTDLEDFCERCKTSKLIGFDTEFVSENRYRPELCLLQVKSDDELAIIDTLKIENLAPFWKMLTTGDHVTIVHAAREEFLFCYRECGQRPKNLFDVQLAAGFVGYDYPASYGNIVAAILNKFVEKGETRTDWARRPLSEKQIKYAAGDVEHLHALYEYISGRLESMGRSEWYAEERDIWLDGLSRAETEPQWHRISGASRLNRRALGILNELWLIRDEKARKNNRSARRVIPDDLLIELAKRGSAKPSHFTSIRGFNNRVAKSLTNDIADAIEKGIDLPDKSLPSRINRSKSINLGLVGQFLATILGVVCNEKKISAMLVGSAQELRNFTAWRMGQLPKEPKPALATGWRSEIVGEAIDRALSGKIALRVKDPHADNPLTIEDLA